MSISAEDLLLEISRCPNVTSIMGGNRHHPCADIVNSQGVKEIDDFQVPEPWNGDIRTAKLLYLSSNPSISGVEEYPRWNSQDSKISDFFHHRFGGGHKLWVKDGKYALSNDGSYLPATAYWSEIVNRSSELFGRAASPGIDYTLTEIVHCKSRNMIGVESAINECAARYLLRVLEVSGANVIASIGKKVGDLLRTALGARGSDPIIGPRKIAGKQRLMLFLAAPASNKPRVISKILTPDQISLVRSYLEEGSALNSLA